jgi:hypothetical protein
VAANARPTSQELVIEIGHVLSDLPVFLTSPLYRRWHRHWGATSAEIAASLPGDALVSQAQFRATRAITINAPPEAVWPWLVQVGCLRAGFYSNDLLDNLAHPSATTLVPGLQHLEVGQWVPMSPSSPPTDSTWAWQLTPTDTNGTRLVTRIHVRYDWRHPLTALMGVVLMEFGDFVMLRRMLRAIRSRAELLHKESSTRRDTSVAERRRPTAAILGPFQ